MASRAFNPGTYFRRFLCNLNLGVEEGVCVCVAGGGGVFFAHRARVFV